MAFDPFEEERKRRKFLQGALGINPILDAARMSNNLPVGVSSIVDAERIRRQFMMPDTMSVMKAAIGQTHFPSTVDLVAMGQSMRSPLEVLARGDFASATARIAAQTMALQKTFQEAAGIMQRPSAFTGLLSQMNSTAKLLDQVDTKFLTSALGQLGNIDASVIEMARTYLDEAGEDQDVEEPVQAATETAIERLNRNTAKRFDELSWIEIAAALWFLLEATIFVLNLLDSEADDLAKETNKITIETRAMVEDNARAVQELTGLAVEGAATLETMKQAAEEIERIDGLPKALVINRGNVREEPKGSSHRIAVLFTGSLLAIEGKQGCWLLVTFQDSLTGTFRQGWIYGSSVEKVQTTGVSPNR